MILSGPPVATGPALAARLGGTFDADNACIGITPDYFIGCRYNGRVTLYAYDAEGILRNDLLGNLSDGIEALVAAYVEVTGLPDPATVTE